MHKTDRGWLPTYSSKLFENVVQAIARDLLADAMVAANEAGMEIFHTVHDEICVLAPVATADATKDRLEALMSLAPKWAAGLPLAAKAGTMEYYRKD